MSMIAIVLYLFVNHGAWLLYTRERQASMALYPFMGAMLMILAAIVPFLPPHIWGKLEKERT
jgi:hypothetical protein